MPDRKIDYLTIHWYAEPNDLIGGWCVHNVPRPDSQLDIENGDRCIASFTDSRTAVHMANLHNTWLNSLPPANCTDTSGSPL